MKSRTVDCGELMEICKAMGFGGRDAAAEGIDPLCGPTRYQLIHALRGLTVQVNRLSERLTKDRRLNGKRPT